MVLKAGGPCIGLKKVKDDEGNVSTAACNKISDHIWYAGPACKNCYECSLRKKRKLEGVATGGIIDMEAVQEEMQETLVEIEEIYGSRCASARTPYPARPSRS